MKHIKKMIYDNQSAPFIERNGAVGPILAALITIGAGVAVMLLTVARGKYAALGWGAAAVLAVVLMWAVVRMVYCIRFPYNIILDDEYLNIRKGNGYLKFHKFDIGQVIYRNTDSESTVDGHGNDDFLISPDRIVFQNAIKPIRRKLKNGEKLAYMLMSVVQNPHSGVNWSLAYDSLPAAKRSPTAF